MLESTWFILWGLTWAIYFMMDGFDLGLGSLFPFLAKNETEKRILFNAMGPFWDGNEVWLVTAGGVTFAAFPHTYAVMFSTLYTPLMLLLFALILRGVAFEFRGKEDKQWWRNIWDFCLVFGSSLPALLLGVTFANLFRGLPIDKNGILQAGFFSLLNPYALLGGITFMLLFAVHGALWLSTRSDGELHTRTVQMIKRLWPVSASVAALFLIMTYFQTRLWHNVFAKPLFLILPVVALAGLFLSRYFVSKGQWWKAWFASAALILCTVLFGVAGMFPNTILSTLDPEASLTAYNTAASPLTLKIMLGVALSVLPFVIGYQIWVHLRFKDTVNEKSIHSGPAY